MSSERQRAELDARAKQGETVIPGGTGGKSLEAQEHFAEGQLINYICICFMFSQFARIVLVSYFGLVD